MTWKIGDGSLANIWRQSWLRSKHNSFISSQPMIGNEHATVNALIHSNYSSWKYDLIVQIFNQRDVQEILPIPLLNKDDTDQIIWKQSPNGSYTVRLAYHPTHGFNCRYLEFEGPWKLEAHLEFKYSSQDQPLHLALSFGAFGTQGTTKYGKKMTIQLKWWYLTVCNSSMIGRIQVQCRSDSFQRRSFFWRWYDYPRSSR